MSLGDNTSFVNSEGEPYFTIIGEEILTEEGLNLTDTEVTNIIFSQNDDDVNLIKQSAMERIIGELQEKIHKRHCI